jgi:hypothetical protein
LIRNFYIQKQISKLELEKELKITAPPVVGRREGIEQEIEESIRKCQAEFDLNKSDFTKPIWDSELSTMLKGLLVIRAVDQNNRNLCNYEKQEIDPGLQKERCQHDYDFYFTLTKKLKKGMGSQQYIKECQEALLPYIFIEIEEGIIEDINRDVLNKELSSICGSYYQSFQNKSAVILDPIFMCDGDPLRDDAVEYVDLQTNQLKSCAGEMNDEIKFLIAIAKNDSTNCTAIKNFRTAQYCQFYFDKDFTTYQNKFKEAYCNMLVQ